MNIIVTGASSGIGYEVVKHFARQKGYKILAIARRHDLLEKLQKECIAYSGEVVPLAFDLISGDYKYLQEVITSTFQEVNILLNNAGTLINKPFLLMSDQELNEMIEGNFKSMVKITKVTIPFMANINSHIVNVSSMSGFQGSKKYSGLAVYSAVKAATASLSEVLSEELKPMNISVNCLALGAVQTEMFEKAFPETTAPLLPNQLATFIVDFCVNGNKYFNGKILPVSLSTP